LTETKAWVAVSADPERAKASPESTWWCLPDDVALGDRVYFYAPRSMSPANQGIYAIYMVKTLPDPNSKDNVQCVGCSSDRKDHKAPLYYVELSINSYFQERVTARDLKSNSIIRKEKLVKLNFQRTVFSISRECESEIVKLIADKENHGRLSST